MVSIAQAYQEEGIRRGREEGIRQGMHNKALDIAKYMLYTLHLDIDKVQQATGLSKHVLEALAHKQLA